MKTPIDQLRHHSTFKFKIDGKSVVGQVYFEHHDPTSGNNELGMVYRYEYLKANGEWKSTGSLFYTGETLTIEYMKRQLRRSLAGLAAKRIKTRNPMIVGEYAAGGLKI
jgi:hypothetical protein